MKTINRDKIQRMIGNRPGGGGGSGNVDLTGMASQMWVDENYVSKEFFARLFTVHGLDENDNEIEVKPNDLDSEITSIQSMVGHWTEEYLSALGIGSGGGGGSTILTEPLASINESGIGLPLSADQVIVWNGSAWAYRPYTTGSGTVTSIRITVPTGFTVNPSTAITTDGTFVIGFDTGYSLPTTDKQGQWDVAYSWVNANAASSVSKTAWGRTYWNAGVPQNISGDIENAAHIKIDNAKSIYWKRSGSTSYLSLITLDSSDNFVIGESMADNGLITYLRGRSITLQTGTGISGNHSASLSSGGVLTVEKLVIGGITISHDTNNGGLHIESAGLYADTYLSALGAGSGGGGGASLTDPLASINTSGMGSPSSPNQVIVWTGSAWAYRPYTTGSGTVTSIRITVPTGFTVNPSQAITTAGTFVIGFDTGYSLPTTDKQGQWDVAYSWVNANAASTVSKTAWGRMYWNAGVPQNISGNIESTGHITPETGGFYEIGTEPSSNNQGLRYKAIHVEEVWINGVKVTADANGVHIVNNGLYADTHISALGAGSGGGGGSTGITIEDVWTAMASTAPDSSSQQINVSHLAQALTTYATTSSVNSAVNTAVSSVTKWLTICNGDGTVIYGTYNGKTAATIKIPSGSTYTLPLAANGTRGGIQIGFTSSGKNYAVQLSNEKAYVYVPWENDDTKNTAGSTNLASTKLFLIGAQTQGANPPTSSNINCYIGTDNCLYSNGAKVLTDGSVFPIGGRGTFNLNTIYDAGFYMIAGGSNVPSGDNYGVLLSLPYRQASGNTSPDFGVQIFIPCGDDGSYPNGLFYRTSQATWNAWQRVVTADTNGNVGIGANSSSSYKLYVNGTTYLGGNTTVNGTVTAGSCIEIGGTESVSTVSCATVKTLSSKGIYIKTGSSPNWIDGNWNSTSDIRRKDVIDYVDADLEMIAKVRIFDFRWKADSKSQTMLGTAAQDWQNIFPNAVKGGPDGYLSMDYSATALAAAVITARKVVNHEKEIARLKKRIDDLEKQLAS